MSLFSNLSRRLSRRSRRPAISRRRKQRPMPTTPAEVLEDRTLLTGLVMDESVFNVGQFAANLEEQIPVDTTGPNGVVGYSYAIITITLATVSQNLLGFDTPLVVNGGFGENHLILHDESSGGSFSYTVTENSIDRLLFCTRHFAGTAYVLHLKRRLTIEGSS